MERVVHLIVKGGTMKGLLLFGGLLVLLSIVSVRADIISGVVSDSEDNTPVFHAMVGTDSLHFVLTDSSGKFSFNTDGNVGARNLPMSSPQQKILWNPAQGTFFLPENAGAVSIQVRNMLGIAVAQYSSGNRSGDSKVSLGILPQGVYIATLRANGQTFVQKIMNVRGLSVSTMRSQASDVRSVNGLAKMSAVDAAMVLSAQKAAYFNYTKTYTGSQSNVAIKLRQDHGLSRHPFLYAGEYQGKLMSNQKMYIVRGGQIVWTFNLAAGSSELDDAWLCSNGTICYSRKIGASGMTMTDQKQTWTFSNTSVDLHTCQPLGLDRVLLMANGNPAHAIIYNIKKSAIEKTMTLTTGGSGTHVQFRLIRMTKAGTLLVAHMDMGKVVEYDTNGTTLKAIWTYISGGTPWAAVRLKNGNTLVSGNGSGWVREVNPAGTVVWEINKNDLPGITLQTVQQCVRLENGNTVICSWNGGALGTADIAVVEVTQAKKVVWQFPTSFLGPATSIQLLDEPGVPEIVGDLQR
jgi:hypothetical protein